MNYACWYTFWWNVVWKNDSLIYRRFITVAPRYIWVSFQTNGSSHLKYMYLFFQLKISFPANTILLPKKVTDVQSSTDRFTWIVQHYCNVHKKEAVTENQQTERIKLQGFLLQAFPVPYFLGIYFLLQVLNTHMLNVRKIVREKIEERLKEKVRRWDVRDSERRRSMNICVL